MKPILKSGVRILRPSEYEALRDSVPKMHHRIILEAALLTGMRWVELQRFYKNPDWYDPEGKYIHLPEGAVLKKKRRMKERYVYLSSRGNTIVPLLLKQRKRIPHRVTWNENLKRWAQYAGIEDIGLTTKTMRKTWESWLAVTYPEKILFIAMSQGHTQLTALSYYLNVPFSKADKEKIREYTIGWLS